jgi:hypothetical protein
LPDRKRYVAWAKDRISKGVSSKPVIPASIQENYASLLEVTQRVGEAQKGGLAIACSLFQSPDVMYPHPSIQTSWLHRRLPSRPCSAITS